MDSKEISKVMESISIVRTQLPKQHVSCLSSICNVVIGCEQQRGVKLVVQ